MTTSGPTSSRWPAMSWITNGPTCRMNLRSSWSRRKQTLHQQVEMACA